jgi:hypothetical protein
MPRWPTAVLTAVSLGLSACVTTAMPAPPAPASPALAFIADAAPGDRASVPIEAGGVPTLVVVERAYASASGLACKRVSMGFGGGSASRPGVACLGPGGWRFTRPLGGPAAGSPLGAG